MNLNDSDIVQIVTTIWNSVLGVDCYQSDAPAPVSSNSIATCIQITGGWQGAVVLNCTKAFAIRAATVMFHASEEDHIENDMQDALAELTNMIGGNLKGLIRLEHACQLSLPAVVSGSDFTTRIPGSRLAKTIIFSCEGQTVVVNILEKLAPACAA